jgi:2-polyprenyl-3-methyl-5-hydroxy-6-metoxy-1,4-benzoquinol methylase
MSEQQPNSPPSSLEIKREAWNAWIKKHIPVRDGRVESSATRAGHGETVLKLLRSLSLLNPDILDVGCANGWLSGKLASLGRVTGIDISDKAIAEAKHMFPNVEFIEDDFMNIDLPTKRFDVAVSCQVIGVVHNQREFVNRLAFVLKQGGWLILLCPNKFVWDRMEYTKDLPDEIPDGRLYRRDLKNLLRDRFTVVHSETVMPDGRRGILRVVNSYRINGALETIINRKMIIRLKQRVGLGKSLVILARKK